MFSKSLFLKGTAMATKSKTSKKITTKVPVKTLDLKRETIKNLSVSEKKKIRGGSGLPSGTLGTTQAR